MREHSSFRRLKFYRPPRQLKTRVTGMLLRDRQIGSQTHMHPQVPRSSACFAKAEVVSNADRRPIGIALEFHTSVRFHLKPQAINSPMSTRIPHTVARRRLGESPGQHKVFCDFAPPPEPFLERTWMGEDKIPNTPLFVWVMKRGWYWRSSRGASR